MRNPIQEPLTKYLRERGLLAAGMSLFVVSLPLYVSTDSRVVLSRWSLMHTGVMVTAAAIWLAVLVSTWRASSRASPHASHVPAWSKSLGVGLFCWGLAYFWGALATNANAGRITDLNVFGSTHPALAMLEWIALACFGVAAMLFAAPKLPKRWQDLGLVIGTILVLAIVAEGAARIKAIALPEVQGFPTYSTRIWRERYVTTNSLGFRDVERSPAPLENTRRVLVIGDSFAFGSGINKLEDRFTEQLAKRLNHDGERWEVINAGLPDTHTLEHIETLKKLLPLQPDLVVLFYSFNDMDYLSPITERGWTSGSSRILDRLHPTRLLFLNSYLFQETYVRLRKLSFVTAESQTGFDVYTSEELLAQHLDDLNRFVTLARDARASVRILPFDNFVGLSEAYRTRYRRLSEAGERHGLPICSIEHAFDGQAADSLQVNSLDGHATAFAYGLAVTESFECLTSETALQNR